jgi:hypothetical protein
MATLRNAFYGLFASLVLLATGVNSALSQTATILPNAKTQFLDANGKPYVGGQVYFYIPNTSTPKTTWQDAFQVTPNAQPVVLDSAGSAFIFGAGDYTETLYDANNNLIWSGITIGLGNGNVIGPGTSVSGDLACWNNTTGTSLQDCGGTTIPGTYTFSSALIAPGLTGKAGGSLLLTAPAGNSVQFAPNGGGATLVVNTNGLVPVGDGTIALGGSGNRWSNIYGLTGTFTNNQNAESSVTSNNNSAGTGAESDFTASNGTGNASFGLGGASYTTVTFLQNRAYVYADAGTLGTVITSAGANPIIFGVSNVEVGRFNGVTAGQFSIGVAGTLQGKLNIASPTANSMVLTPAASATGTATIQSGTYNIVGNSTTDTLTNKTLSSSTDVLGGVTMTLGSDATGDIYYRNSGGQLARLAVCTGTQVLGASGGLPACVTQGGTGAAWTYLCTITASASASINNASPTSGSCPINNSYTSYRLVFQNLVPATNEKIMELQVHSGGAYKATGYLTNENILINGAVAGSSGITTYIPITYPLDANGDAISNTAPGLSGEVTIINPSVSGLIMVNGSGAYLDGAGVVTTETISGYWNTAGVVDGFQILMDSGNLTSGSVLVYGVQ